MKPIGRPFGPTHGKVAATPHSAQGFTQSGWKLVIGGLLGCPWKDGGTGTTGTGLGFWNSFNCCWYSVHALMLAASPGTVGAGTGVGGVGGVTIGGPGVVMSTSPILCMYSGSRTWQ